MRLPFLIIISGLLPLVSCSYISNIYLRNLTRETVMADVYILHPEDSLLIPKRVRTANDIAVLNRDFITGFNDTSEIRKLDQLHYRVMIRPGTSICLSDITGTLMNGMLHTNLRVVILSSGRVDTLMNGLGDIRREKFEYIHRGMIFPRYVSYYDCIH